MLVNVKATNNAEKFQLAVIGKYFLFPKSHTRNIEFCDLDINIERIIHHRIAA